MKTLPNKPSDLLELALSDLEKCSKDKRYKLNMHTWHAKNNFSKEKLCHVCMAGAVMAKTLNVGIDEIKNVDSFTFETRDKIMAIDALRQGLFLSACVFLGISNRGFSNVNLVPISLYRDSRSLIENNPIFFKNVYKKFIKNLREWGF